MTCFLDSQGRQRESNEYEQTSGLRENGPTPGATPQGVVDRRSLRGDPCVRVGVYRVASRSGTAIRQLRGFEFHRGPFRRSWNRQRSRALCGHDRDVRRHR